MNDGTSERNREQEHRGAPLSDDEIDLGEVWTKLWRRRRLILAVTITTAAVAGIIAFVIPSVFDSRAVIQIGQIGHIIRPDRPEDSVQAQFRYIERPQVLVERLKQAYRVGERNPPTPLPRVESVEPVDRNNASGLVEITARAYSAEEGQAFLRQVTGEVLEHHRTLFRHVTELHRDERVRLAAAATGMREEIARLNKELGRASSKSDAFTALMLMEKARRFSELNALENEILEADLLLSPANSYESRLILEPTLRRSPAWPNRVLIVALTAAAGLFLGMLLAVRSGSNRPVRRPA
jgi:uncharacterized protein involved in exopolysaccharide biosynthesis